jgi:signal transduction histidine kinase
VKLTRPSGLTLLAGALLLLMPALAVLQFRWVGQVSDAEHDRMQRNVELAATLFRGSFEEEVLRAPFRTLPVGAQTVREAAWDRYAQRYDDWAGGAHPAIVKNVYLVDAESNELGPLRWNVDQRTFERIPWPASLAPWRPDFDKALADFISNPNSNPAQFLIGDRFPDVGAQAGLLITALRNNPVRIPAQIRANPTAGTRTESRVTIYGYTVIELDLAFIKEKLLPELWQRYFTHPNGESYRVAVVDADNPAMVIYRSDDNAPTDSARADTTLPIFSRFGRTGPGGPPRDARTSAPPRAGASDNRGAEARAPATRADAGPQRQAAFDDVPGRWRLLVQHQSGSLESAVNGARSRNLALSFGVLLLLTCTIGLLTVTSRRSQQIAQQQMEFFAGVSHELRTPVAVIKAAAENLSQGVVGNADRVKRYGKMIETEARRLGEMVERVLQYAGIESGLGYGARAPLAPAELVESAIDSALPLLGPETVNIQRDIPESLPNVIGDAAALRSAVQNLVANAVKYGGSDRWVGVKAQEVRDNRAWRVRITVSDHGPGIPANELPHIFDPFYRGGDALSKQIHGNGLGLSLVKRIVTAHGGQVTVVTRAGAGSAFTIELPASEPDASATAVTSGMRAAVHP